MTTIHRLATALVAVTLFALAASAPSTGAILSDAETAGNEMASGQLDLLIGAETDRNSERVHEFDPRDNPGPIFEETDITPGDRGTAVITTELLDNPGYRWFAANQTSNTENDHMNRTFRRTEYYQLDLTVDERHTPSPGDADGNLFLAALSDSEVHDELNPTLYRESTVPDGVSLAEPRFTITDRTASIQFTVEDGHEAELFLSSFELIAPYKGWKDPQVEEQEHHDTDTGTFGPGTHTLEVELPYRNVTGPTTETGDTTPETGELGKYLQFVVWNDDGDGQYDGEEVLFNGTAHEFGEQLEGDQLLEEDPTAAGASHLAWQWWLPRVDGVCAVQTDGKTFDVSFWTQQGRHNPDPVFDEDEYFTDREESTANTFTAGTWDCEPSHEYYQLDLVGGEPIQNLSHTTYHGEDRMIRDAMIENGSIASQGYSHQIDCITAKDEIDLSGEVARVQFSVESGCDGKPVSFVSYGKPFPGWIEDRAGEQQLVDATTHTYAEGTYTMEVQVP